MTEWLRLVLSGAIAMEDAPPAIQSWARLSIYEGALEIIQMEWREDRKSALGKVPAKIRPHVAAEVARIWPMRDELLGLDGRP